MERIYDEVVCNYNNGDGFWTLDAWYPNNDEGTVIGVINELTGGVYLFKDNDPLAEEVAKEKVKEIESEKVETLAHYYNHLTDDEKEEFLKLTKNR